MGFKSDLSKPRTGVAAPGTFGGGSATGGTQLTPTDLSGPPKPGSSTGGGYYFGNYNDSQATGPDGTSFGPTGNEVKAFDQSQSGFGETTATDVTGRLLNSPSNSQVMLNNNQGAFAAPGQGEQYWSGISGQFNGGGPMVADNAQGAYDSYMKSMPQISPEANVGGYYEQARQRFGQDTNTALGARGAFNSSAALDKLSQGSAKLNAEQANAESKYGLDRASTMGQLAAIGGTLARGADTSSLAQADSKRNWYETGGVLSGKAQELSLDRAKVGMDAAGQADDQEQSRLIGAATTALGGQGARDSRIQTLFENKMRVGDATAKVAAKAYEDIIAGDQAAKAAALGGDLSYFTEKYSMSEAEAQKFTDDIKSAVEIGTAAG